MIWVILSSLNLMMITPWKNKWMKMNIMEKMRIMLMKMEKMRIMLMKLMLMKLIEEEEDDIAF